MRLFSDRIEPEKTAFDRITGLGEINTDTDSGTGNISANESGLKKIGKVAPAAELVDICFDSLVIAISLYS